MSLPCPKIDDRTFNDIVEEAKKKIPKLCPSWTDFNPSDPGVTLVELMAWMTEMIIYRLNRVPEKNYLKFLELMGISLTPPQPAKTWVVFTPAAGTPAERLGVISEGVKVSTKQTKDEPVVFETRESLNLTNASVKRIISVHSDDTGQKVHTDLTHIIGDDTGSAQAPFEGSYVPAPHMLYLGYSDIGDIAPADQLKCRFRINIAFEKASNFEVGLEWEYWDGQQWSIVNGLIDGTDGLCVDGDVIFDPLPFIKQTELYGIQALWIRARHLAGYDLPRFTNITKSIEFKPDHRLVPDKGFINAEASVYLPIDFAREFYPFGKTPVTNAMLYLACWAFSLNTKVLIKVNLSKHYEETDIKTIKKLKIHWQYYSRSGDWKLLGIVGPNANFIVSNYDFQDGTKAFTDNGTISFHCPTDIATYLLQGEENFWIRATIAEGDYSADEPDSPARDNYPTEEHYAPIINRLFVSFEEEPKTFDHYLAYNDFAFEELTSAIDEGTPIEPFKIDPDEDPAFYLAFASPLSSKLHRIYFHLDGDEATIGSPVVVWEYFGRNGWQALSNVAREDEIEKDSSIWKELKVFKDTTKSLSQSGAIEFIASEEWDSKEIFETEGYWLRARFKGGTSVKIPRLIGVHLNATEVIQAVSYRGEILGSSSGGPYQMVQFNQTPVLPNPKIIIKEREKPSDDEIHEFRNTLRDDVIEEIDPKTKRVKALWVRWHEVENFFMSRPDSRHYTLDLFQGTVNFGDGLRGMIPPQGIDNIKGEVYYVGGGAKGNVGKGTITLMEQTIPFVQSVTNPYSAGGGADAETLEDAKLRGPWTLKHRYRAVTTEDFEWLAKESTGEVAKARCFTDGDVIKVMIIPKGDANKLQPSAMLVQHVRDYLDKRRLVTCRLQVNGPGYVDITVEAEVAVLTQKFHASLIVSMEREMETTLRRFFHPLIGGPRGGGWPMGRTVHISELFYLLESFDGVDYVDKISLLDSSGEYKEKVSMKDENDNIYLPYLKEVNIKVIKTTGD